MITISRYFIAALFITLFGANAFAGHDDIHIHDVTIRATTPNAGATAVYAMIHNHGDEQDRLVGGRVTFAKKVEIHEMKMDGDVMKMREIEGGLVIPSDGMAHLKKGGNHMMVMGLSEPIKMDGAYEVTFSFEKAGDITVPAVVISLAGKAKATHDHDHKSHDHKDHDHEGHKH